MLQASELSPPQAHSTLASAAGNVWGCLRKCYIYIHSFQSFTGLHPPQQLLPHSTSLSMCSIKEGGLSTNSQFKSNLNQICCLENVVPLFLNAPKWITYCVYSQQRTLFFLFTSDLRPCLATQLLFLCVFSTFLKIMVCA